MNIVLPLLSSLLSLIFMILVFDQFLAKRRPYQLVWSIGLMMYFISTGCEFFAELDGVSSVVFRLWYLVGAILVAAYLGMGTIYLLARRKVAHIILGLLVAASIYAAFSVFTANIDLNALKTGTSGTGPLLSGKALPMTVRILTPFFNTFGTIALVGGAIYSAWYFWRHKIMPHRVLSNALIALGAILPAFGGTLMRFGLPQPFYMLELLGIIVIFIGFLRSSEVFGIYRFPFIHGVSRISD